MSRMLRALQQIEAKSPSPSHDTQDTVVAAVKDPPDSRDEPARDESARDESAKDESAPEPDVTTPEPVGEEPVQDEPVRGLADIEATIAHAEIVAEMGADVGMVETVFTEIPESDQPADEVSNIVLCDGQSIPEPVVSRPLPRPTETPPEFWSVPRGPGISEEIEPAVDETARNILGQIDLDRPTALLFTSPGDGETKLGLTVSLAAALAGHTTGEVLVVDADLRTPTLGAYLGINAPRGLAHVLMGTAEWEPLVRRSTTERLSLLPGCSFPMHDGPASGRSNRRLGPLVNELKKAYSLVLVDAASLAHDEVAPASGDCDGTYLTVRLGRTTRRSVRQATRVIENCGGRLLGTIVVRD